MCDQASGSKARKSSSYPGVMKLADLGESVHVPKGLEIFNLECRGRRKED